MRFCTACYPLNHGTGHEIDPLVFRRSLLAGEQVFPPSLAKPVRGQSFRILLTPLTYVPAGEAAPTVFASSLQDMGGVILFFGFLCVSAVYTIQYLSNAEPQVKPPPKASINRISPRWIRPSRTATSRASGTEAADVLPCSSTVTTT